MKPEQRSRIPRQPKRVSLKGRREEQSYRSFNNQSGYKQLLELIQPINEIRAPNQFTISAILLNTLLFPQSEQLWQCQASHPPRIHFPALSQRLTKGGVSPPVTLPSGKYILLRTPRSFPSHLIVHSCVTCSPYPRDYIHIFEIKGYLPDTKIKIRALLAIGEGDGFQKSNNICHNI